MNRKNKPDLKLRISNSSGQPLSTPQIIIQSPSCDLLPFFDDESVPDNYGSVTPLPSKHELKDSKDLLIGDSNEGLLGDEDLDARLAPLPESDLNRKNSSALRRNSISLPAGLNTVELETLRQQHINHAANIPENRNGSDSTTCSADCDGSLEGLNEILAEERCAKIPLRSARRKSVMAAPPRSPDGDSSTLDSYDDYSPDNSITSRNSLASLLKEKLQSIPSKIKRRPSDYKLKAFVSFLFLCIIFFVSFAYVMYHQQVLARAYFDKIKFSKSSRIMKIYNGDDVEILRGHLGAQLGRSNAYRCLVEELLDEDVLCFEWLNGLRLFFDKIYLEEGKDTDIQCYSIKWQAFREGVHPTDCFDWSTPQDHWYGGGQPANLSWPLGKSFQDFTPFITGDSKKHQWGNILMRYFISSKGVAIIVDDQTPLYVSYNNNNDNRFCLRARYDDFAYVNRESKYLELKYTVCTSTNIKTLHSALSQQSLWDGLKQEDISVLHSLLSEPVWHIAPKLKSELTESLIYNYTEDVIALGFLKQGHVLINEFWQDHVGDFTLDQNRFPTLQEIVDIIHRRGFRIVFTIQPFISTESPNFPECVQNNLLIAERFSEQKIAALTRYKSLASAGVLDITNNRTLPWLNEKLKKVVSTYQIDAFFLDTGSAYDMPHYYQCEKNLMNPDEYKTILTNSFDKSLCLIGVSSAVKLPRPPIFVSLPPFQSSWKDIQKVIPTVLSYGIIGYPFLMPGAVGGDIYWPGSEQYVPGSTKQIVEQMFNDNETDPLLPEKELYLRWLQLATFLPVMKFTHLPSKYNDEQVLEVAKILTTLRQKTVTPLLIKYSEQALDAGLPLIRPLWMLEPNDPACYTVDDEFSVGDELIVAPVLEKGVIHREVYLPSGVWKDGIDGSLRKGSRWIHDYKAPTDKVAYFVKMPDNTRF